MEERINQALVQLESDLQSLQSAKEQVEKTVGASAELQKTVGEYVASVKNLCVTLKTWENNLKTRESSLSQDVESSIADIERTCSTLITTFNTNVDKATTTFQTGTKTVLDNFLGENNKLVEHVKSLHGLREQLKKAIEEILILKDSLSQISKDLKESLDEQDKVLNNIQQKVTNFTSQVHEESLLVVQTIFNSEKTLKDSINITVSKADEIIVSIKGLTSNLNGLNTLCQNINSSIISSTTNLTNVMTGARDEINGKLTTEVGKLESGIAGIESLCKGISSSIETFFEQTLSVLNSLKANEQDHFNTILKQFEEQEMRLNTEFNVVRKQNKIFSFVIIVLLALIIVIFAFGKSIC